MAEVCYGVGLLQKLCLELVNQFSAACRWHRHVVVFAIAVAELFHEKLLYGHLLAVDIIVSQIGYAEATLTERLLYGVAAVLQRRVRM